jgi:L-amino acid N-acyltransferase
MIEIRNAIEDDLPAMLDIYNDVIANTTAVWYYEPHTLQMRKEWFDQRQQQGFPIFVAEQEGKIVGFSCRQPWQRGGQVAIAAVD